VDTIDVYRLAYACGLRIGDRIRSVNGYRVRTHRQLVERILEMLNDGGATLRILRDEGIESVVLRPIDLYHQEIELYPLDSLYIDTLPPDSAGDQ
jgi:S1-C subfamily serine protease